MKIFCKFPIVNISKLHFWLLICIAKDFIWTTLKAIFSVFLFLIFFLHPQIPDFQIVVSRPNIVTVYPNKPCINGKAYLFSFQMMYKLLKKKKKLWSVVFLRFFYILFDYRILLISIFYLFLFYCLLLKFHFVYFIFYFIANFIVYLI